MFRISMTIERDYSVQSWVWSQLKMKLSLAIGEQHNLELALLRLGERGAIDLLGMAVAGGVLHFERTTAAQLDPVVEAGAGGQGVGSEAGAGIIDFEQLYRGAGAVFDGSFNLIGVTGGGWDQGCEG